MKILFISYSDGGGAAKAIFNLIKSFGHSSKYKLLVIDKKKRIKQQSYINSGFWKSIKKIEIFNCTNNFPKSKVLCNVFKFN